MASDEDVRAEVRKFLAALDTADLETTTSRAVRTRVGETLGVEDMKPHRQIVESEIDAFLKKRKAGPLPETTPAKKNRSAGAQKSEAQAAPPSTSGGTVFELASKRKVSIRDFKGKLLIDVRDFYEKNGEELPGQKGLALSPEQWAIVEDQIPHVQKAKDDRNFEYSYDLGNSRKLTVDEFKGTVRINLREFYEKDGKSLPGKKGISLTLDEWSRLVDHAPTITKKIGELVPAPKVEKKVKDPESAPQSEEKAAGAAAESAAAAKGDDSGPSHPSIVHLNETRRASISEFRGSKLLDLREYYSKDGEMRPGKKGISLTKAQAEKLLEHAEQLSEKLSQNVETTVALGNRRYAKVKKFKDSFSVDVREFYETNGEENPGAKGLSMRHKQWERLTENLQGLIAQM